MERSPEKMRGSILVIVRKFLAESGAERAARAASEDAFLERDLGIGSLEKTELFHRIEKAFHVQLPQSLMVDAKTVNDLMDAVLRAHPPEMLATQKAVENLEEKQTDPSKATTLIAVLRLYAENDPDRPHIYLQNEHGEEEIIRYGKLYERAKKTAAGLVSRGIKSSETVAIMLPTSPEFFYAFFGILLVGAIPVPIYPPFRVDQIEAYAKREALILRNASVRILITFSRAEALSKLLQNFIPSLIDVTTVKDLMVADVNLPETSLEPTDPALIQYTSGSTGNPKGVLLTQANLLANMRAYGSGIQVKPTDVIVSWLPLYHDMGLIGAWLGSLYYGIPLTLMSPLLFLSRPERWLWAIHYHRGTLSAGPNFAYELCIKKIEDELIEGLDLSSWRLAFNGAEMVHPKTLDRFSKRFARYGFKKTAFFPVYGLAECSLALAFPDIQREPKLDRVQREVFEKEGRAIPIASGEKKFYEFVCCGKSLDDHDIRIVDDNNNALEERQVGHIQFRGPSAMQGYYRNPDATKAVYHDGWWSTGDLGYLANEELFITGRLKDLIIKAGRNYLPAEIEDAASLAKGVRKGCVAAFGVVDEESGTEKLIVVAEAVESNKNIFSAIRAEAIEKIIELIGVPPDAVIIVPPYTIPKTSSGKLRRSDCKANYLKGRLGRRGKSVQWQMIKLISAMCWQKVKFSLAGVLKFIFSIYVAAVLVLTVTPLWIIVSFSSREQTSKWFRRWSRWIFRLCFCPLFVVGSQNLKEEPMVYVANHASYVDAIILAGLLPPHCNFIAKSELLKAPIIKTFMKQLDYIAVDRMDISNSKSDTDSIADSLKSGRSIMIFPEGMFSYATGVRPFKSGAFKIAVETKIPICPIAISGARKLLRSDDKLPKPAVIKVTIGEPIVPKASDWDEVVRLRDESRKIIAQASGEQMIDLILAGLPSEGE